jgi:two-component system KDP operon response regulator KdpE
VTTGASAPGTDRRHVLVVEEDPAIGRLVSLVLTGEHYRVTVVDDQAAARVAIQQDSPDVILLDIALPAEAPTQLALVREVRQTPVIVITETNDESVLVDALEAGAFDIALKPFAPERLEATVGVACGVQVAGRTDLTSHDRGALTLDFATLTAVKSGIRQPLSLSEWRFLEALAARPGQTVLYQEVLRHVLGPAYREYVGVARLIAARLQKKVSLAEYHGVGYALLV